MLFVIIMEALSKMISATVNGGFLEGFFEGLGILMCVISLISCLQMTL